MNRHAITLVAAALSLAGCHAPQQATGNEQAQTAANAEARAFASKIDALTEPQRQGVFMRAITDAGLNCQKITSAKPHDPINGRPAWGVACLDGVFVVVAAPDNTLQIVPGVPTTGS